jgi:hypothetical protein
MHVSRVVKIVIVIILTSVNAVALAQDAVSTPAPPPEILGESLAKITKIYGSVSESGIYKAKEPLTYNFWYTRPQTFAVQYTKPKVLAGSTISFDGDIFRLIIRGTRNALVIRGLAPDQKLMRNTVLNFGERASYSVTSSATENSVSIQLMDGEKGLSNFKVDFEKQFSFPHKVQFQADSTAFRREFTRLDFDPEKLPPPPREFIPADAEAFDWNLNLRNVLVAGSNLDLDFGVDSPKVIGDFVMEKVVYQRYSRNAMAARFNSKDGRYIVMAVHNRKHGSAIPEELGTVVKAPDGIEGRIIPGPPMNIYTFVKGDARYYLIGNASIPELVSFSTSIPAKESSESNPKKTAPGK